VFFLLVPARNLIVTGKPTLIPTQGPITLWMGNTPPPGVYPNPPPNNDYNHAVRVYATTEPRHFATWLIQKTCFAFGYYGAIWWPWPSQIQHALVVTVSWILTGVAAVFAIRQNRATLLILLIAAIRVASVIVFYPDDRYLVPTPMALIPLTAVGLVSLWQWRPLIAMIAVLTIAGEHYFHTKPQLGTLNAWPSGRLFGPISYAALRAQLAPSVPATTRFKWVFPGDGPLWKPRDAGVGVINDGAWTFHYFTGAMSGIISPPMGVPTALVETIEIEAAFTGAMNAGHIYLFADGKATGIYFPIDHTGRMRTYRIPVWQSRDWKGTLEKIEIYYRGDTFEPRRIELMTYPVVPATVASTR
jgi:hypothetical protein